jgi:hypothetical protein
MQTIRLLAPCALSTERAIGVNLGTTVSHSTLGERGRG